MTAQEILNTWFNVAHPKIHSVQRVAFLDAIDLLNGRAMDEDRKRRAIGIINQCKESDQKKKVLEALNGM